MDQIIEQLKVLGDDSIDFIISRYVDFEREFKTAKVMLDSSLESRAGVTDIVIQKNSSFVFYAKQKCDILAEILTALHRKNENQIESIVIRAEPVIRKADASRVAVGDEEIVKQLQEQYSKLNTADDTTTVENVDDDAKEENSKEESN